VGRAGGDKLSQTLAGFPLSYGFRDITIYIVLTINSIIVTLEKNSLGSSGEIHRSLPLILVASNLCTNSDVSCSLGSDRSINLDFYHGCIAFGCCLNALL